MVGSADTVGFRLWPPVAVYTPLLLERRRDRVLGRPGRAGRVAHAARVGARPGVPGVERGLLALYLALALLTGTFWGVVLFPLAGRSLGSDDD